MIRNRLAREDHSRFFVFWVRKFLSLEPADPKLTLFERLDLFFQGLQAEARYQDWQVTQAERALDITPIGPNKQSALSVTEEIRKNLAIMKKAFLRGVILLGRVRDEKFYAELGHATIEEYADTFLGIKRSALAMYLRVYDWMRKDHPAWLESGSKGKLADLNEAIDLIRIEKEIARKSLPADKKATLHDLKKKALAGTLRRSEVRACKASGNNKITDGNRAFFSKLRRLQEYGAALAGLPEGVIGHLEAAIDILNGAVADAKKKGVQKSVKRPETGF